MMKKRSPDYIRSYRIATTWALLRERLAIRCVVAVSLNKIDAARVLARRHLAADVRAVDAQRTANRQEREHAANLRGMN